MTEKSKPKTMTQNMKAKKRVGRPSGRRNRVSTKEGIEKALATGKDLAEIRAIFEHFVEHAEEYGMNSKAVLDYLKADIDLYKWMIETLAKMESNKEKLDKGEQAEALPEGQIGNVVAFSLTAEE